MKPTISEKFIAHLTLLSGLILSVVAEYYSIVGLTAIFSAAAFAVIIMGITLGISKVVATVWLKWNWNIAPFTIKIYLSVAIVVLMLITAMGIFGFLSKAHSDQSLVSGDVLAKIAVYDEKIKTAKENIDANRKAIKQLDEAVDQVMARSSDEKGADKAVAIRRSQQKERSRLLSEIESYQKIISGLNEAAAPIRAEVRKVEAEVGPIKYLAAFIYGSTDQDILERAVTWMIVIIIFVFDPLAIVMLLAAQTSYQSFRSQAPIEEPQIQAPIPIVEENVESTIVEPVVETPKEPEVDQHAYLKKPWSWKTPDITPQGPVVYKEETTEPVVQIPPVIPDYVQNEEQQESNLWSSTLEGATDHQSYKKAVEAKREKEIQDYAHMVRSRQMELSEVPVEYQDIIKSKV